MADAPAKGKKKLPTWALIGGGVVLLYLAYKFFTSSSNSSTTSTTTTGAGSTPDTTGSSGGTDTSGSLGSADSSGVSESDLVTALGGQQTSLLSALETSNQDVLGLAQSQIAAAQQNPAISPSSTSETQPAAGTQPGGSNAPIITYVSPTATGGTLSSQPSTTTKAPSKSSTTVSRYYTYKRDVPLKQGQTVHFLAGRGYYAA